MQTLRVLGAIHLSSHDGTEVDALLRQPKQLALLAYLCLPRPGTWHRRDSLLGVFWPELDQSRARTSLRSALHALRRQLGEGTIRTRGDDEVGIDPALLSTDAGLMLDDLDAGRHCDALARYGGDLMPGFYVAASEGFEPWLTQERARFRELAQKAATVLTDRLESAGDLGGALEMARRAADLNPNDEAAVRRLIALLDRTGDRAQAFAVYERFRNHVRSEFGVQPSAETTALVDAVRTRRVSTIATPAAPVVAIENDAAKSSTPSSAALPDPEGEASFVGSRRILQRISQRIVRRRVGVAAAIAVVAVAVAAAYRNDIPGSAVARGSGRVLVVLPMENETGDSAQSYIAKGIADGVGRRLEQIGGLKIRSGARSEWPAAVRHDPLAIGRQFGAKILLRTTLATLGDSFELRASVVDASSGSETALAARAFGTSDLPRVESDLTAAVVGAVFRVPLPAVPRRPNHVVAAESYRTTLEGWHELLDLAHLEIASQRFREATEIDPTNARAFAGLSSVLASQAVSEKVPFDIAYDRASAAATRALALDSLEGTAWANLGLLRALRYNDLAAGLSLIQNAKRLEPSNAEVFLVSESLYRHAHLWDKAVDEITVARELDPFTSRYLESMVGVELCADRPDAAIRQLQAELVVAPSSAVALASLVRAFARTGRYDEAIDAWRKEVTLTRDTLLARVLDTARGEQGYWHARHTDGRRRLALLERDSSQHWTSPLRFLQAHFAAGDTSAGFALADTLARRRMPAMYKLPCMVDLDEVRRTPRFKAVAERIGALR
jgi:DNA-binding SARP family transcriptional activator/TolB-like protein